MVPVAEHRDWQTAEIKFLVLSYKPLYIESSREQGIKTVTIPFEIAAEYLPRLRENQDLRIQERFAALPPNLPAFEEIIHQSDTMMGRGMQRRCY